MGGGASFFDKPPLLRFDDGALKSPRGRKIKNSYGVGAVISTFNSLTTDTGKIFFGFRNDYNGWIGYRSKIIEVV